MIVVSVRTMEFCRQLGIAPAVHHWGFPLDHGLDSVFVTGMQGHELGRVTTPPLSVEFETPFSPERERPCPQTWFDPILKREAERHRNVELRFETALESFDQDENGVTARLVDARSGEKQTVRASYLVGCDGYSSTVRELLGIEVRGIKQLDTSTSVYLTIPNLHAQHRHGDAYRYLFVGEEGVRCVLTTIDGKDFYRIQLIDADPEQQSKEALDALMRRWLGEGVAFRIDDVSTWVRKSTVADRFMDGRVFLAGDCAHAHPPNGGLGMNTGILDAWDLGWKLAAVLDGWGGPTLLDSYDFERRPASARASDESLRNYRRLVDDASYVGIDEDSAAGDALRASTGARLVAQNERAWHPIGIHMGHVYAPSPVVVDDGSPAEETSEDYLPTARPGARAPHAWLSSGRSLLDLFGSGFTLLKFRDAETGPLEQAAVSRGLPMTVHAIADAAIAVLYEKALVLVRPDGHVAWRGDACPADGGSIIDQVRAPARASRRGAASFLTHRTSNWRKNDTRERPRPGRYERRAAAAGSGDRLGARRRRARPLRNLVAATGARRRGQQTR